MFFVFGGHMGEFGIEQFISEGALKKHRDYAESVRLCEQVKRSGKTFDDRSLMQLYRQRTKASVAPLYADAVESFSHTLYFSSFCMYPTVSDEFCGRFGGLTSFFHRLFTEACEARAFFYIGTDAHEHLCLSDDIGVFLRKNRLPALAVDVCEHAYFTDYGFDKIAYIRAAVGHLDVGCLLTDTERHEKSNVSP